jgi:sec-independent protein translocase protein TatA
MNPLLAMFGLGGTELIVVFALVLILFGAKKIPDFAKGLGQGIKEFRKASREVQEEIERAGQDLDTPPPAPASTSPAAAAPPAASPEEHGAAGAETAAPEAPPSDKAPSA